CLTAGTVFIAVDPSGADVGFAALGTHDGEPFLDQLSVRMSHMQRGIGTMLLGAVTTRAAQEGGGSLWLTTYDHLPWNRPFYERHGFVRVPLEECAAGVLAEFRHECRWLPQPEQRVVMKKSLR